MNTSILIENLKLYSPFHNRSLFFNYFFILDFLFFYFSFNSGIYIPISASVLNKENQLDIMAKNSAQINTRNNIAEKYILKRMKKQSFFSLNRSVLGTIYQMIEKEIDLKTVNRIFYPTKIIFPIGILFLTGYFR